MNTYKTIFYIVTGLAVLVGGIFFVLKEQDGAPAASAQAVILSSDSDAHINYLMSSLNMQRPSSPVQSPDFELMSINGEQHTLGRHRGKVVLLSFWATW